MSSLLVAGYTTNAHVPLGRLLTLPIGLIRCGFCCGFRRLFGLAVPRAATCAFQWLMAGLTPPLDGGCPVLCSRAFLDAIFVIHKLVKVIEVRENECGRGKRTISIPSEPWNLPRAVGQVDPLGRTLPVSYCSPMDRRTSRFYCPGRSAAYRCNYKLILKLGTCR